MRRSTHRLIAVAVATALAGPGAAAATTMGSETPLPRAGSVDHPVAAMGAGGGALIAWAYAQGNRERPVAWTRRGPAAPWTRSTLPLPAGSSVDAASLDRHGDAVLIAVPRDGTQQVLIRRGWSGRWTAVASPQSLSAAVVGDDHTIDVVATEWDREPAEVGGYWANVVPYTLADMTWRRLPGLSLRRVESPPQTSLAPGGRLLIAWRDVGGPLQASTRTDRLSPPGPPAVVAPSSATSLTPTSAGFGVGGTQGLVSITWAPGAREIAGFTSVGSSTGSAWTAPVPVGRLSGGALPVLIDAGRATLVFQDAARSIRSQDMAIPTAARTLWSAPVGQNLRGAARVGRGYALLLSGSRGVHQPGSAVVVPDAGPARRCAADGIGGMSTFAAAGGHAVAVTVTRADGRPVVAVRAFGPGPGRRTC